MTCSSEPAKYDQRNAAKDMANKYSQKMRMGTDKRPCMEPIKPKTPGPGR